MCMSTQSTSIEVLLMFPIRGNAAKLHKIKLTSTNSLNDSQAVSIWSKQDTPTPPGRLPEAIVCGVGDMKYQPRVTILIFFSVTFPMRMNTHADSSCIDVWISHCWLSLV